MPLLLLFIVMPVAEMWLLITVGQQIGAPAIIGLLLITAAAGFALLKQQGFATLFRARQKLDSGELPASEMAEAIILAVCGALLLTPGFFTDAVGFVGLVPMFRRSLIQKIVANMQVAAMGGSFSEYEVHRSTQQSNANQQGSSNNHPTTFEGEFWRENEQIDNSENSHKK